MSWPESAFSGSPPCPRRSIMAFFTRVISPVLAANDCWRVVTWLLRTPTFAACVLSSAEAAFMAVTPLGDPLHGLRCLPALRITLQELEIGCDRVGVASL